MRHRILTLYRLRGPLFYAATVVLVLNVLIGVSPVKDAAVGLRTVVAISALAVFVFSIALTYLGPRLIPADRRRTVHSPVAGRWLGLNSPATKVPSHGVRMYGQAYALDVVFEPKDGARPDFGGEPMRANTKYPAFGEPVYSMVDGVVVRASYWRRDHRARSNALTVYVMLAEGAVREIGGPGFVIGNHVTIRTDSGEFAVVAHLKRGSARVRVGDRVQAGTHIGDCGNSGNSSEPHVHAQLMDRASPWTGIGLPMAFRGITLGDDPDVVDGLPENGQHMTSHTHT